MKRTRMFMNASPGPVMATDSTGPRVAKCIPSSVVLTYKMKTRMLKRLVLL